MVRRVSQTEVTDALRRAGTVIPDRFYLGTAKHESGFDAECVTHEPNGKDSLGLYQVNADEAREAGEDPSDLFDVDTNTRTYVYCAERNRAAIRAELGLDDHVPDPADMGAYLSVAHNQGLQAALDTIRTNGLDWSGPGGYADRNGDKVHAGFNGPAIVAYGNDCLYTAPVSASGVLPLALLAALALGVR